METKKCAKCGETKPISDFSFDKNKGKYSYYCKACRAKMARVRRAKNKITMTEEEKKIKRKTAREALNDWRKRRKIELIKKLGGKCVVPGCNWIDYRVLQIDHIHGGGGQERKKYKNYDRYMTYLLNLSNDELHKNYQLLCANHNWLKRYEELGYLK